MKKNYYNFLNYFYFQKMKEKMMGQKKPMMKMRKKLKTMKNMKVI